MSEPIAEQLENNDLHRFRNDFRRAVMMHRKGLLNFFFRLHFPNVDGPLDESVGTLEYLDFRHWLEEVPPVEVSGHWVYRELVVRQDKLSLLAKEVLDEAINGSFQPMQLANLVRALHEFDRFESRLDSGINLSLTDVDTLTGLRNRAAMERDLDREHERAKLTGRHLTIAMLDIDEFKNTNDEYGHCFGDVVLETLAQRFVESLRPQDMVYRYGGEEFLVLLTDTSLEKAAPVLERLRQRACKNKISDGKNNVHQSVSIGLAEVAENELIGDAIERADKALYRAKEAGRNRVELDHLDSDQI
ncbi:MAG: GGDEF domain-containing protein [Formivibrio sp.]|nr:GGDEF domain-containing protein [Formivibrio sp.]